MIVQLSGTKYVQICEAVWASRAHKVPQTDGRTDRCTDTHTDMNPMSLVRGELGDKNSNLVATRATN